MAQSFPRWANTAVRATLIVGIAIVVGAPAALLAWARSPQATGQYVPLEQPVNFSHPLHVHALRIDCRYCHAGAERTAAAGLPPTESCVPCHHQTLVQTRTFAAVRRSMDTGTPIPWQRVTSVPDFVFFNHGVHTQKGIGCESCHGRVDRMERVTQVAPLTMGWCVDCHRAPERYIRPKEAVTAMGWPAPTPKEGLALVSAYRVRRVTTCTGCHR